LRRAVESNFDPRGGNLNKNPKALGIPCMGGGWREGDVQVAASK